MAKPKKGVVPPQLRPFLKKSKSAKSAAISGGKKKAKLGSGKRFAALKRKLAARRGKSKVSDPGALAAYIGRKKFGAAKFAKLSAAGRASTKSSAKSKKAASTYRMF
jgi:hypothetical protein